jgi:hypothetical protein
MKSVLDELRPEPRRKMWQTFDVVGIVHKELVPPGQTVTFLSDLGNTSGANVQTSGETAPGPCIMTNLRLTRHSLWGSFWLLRIRQLSPRIPYSQDRAPCNIFLFRKMKLKLKGRRFDSIEEIQNESQEVTKTLMLNVFQKCFRSWKSR